jgi:hypothetical protein
MTVFSPGFPALGYLTPETFVPIISLIAGGAGVLIGFGVRVVRLPLMWLRRIGRICPHRAGTSVPTCLPADQGVEV